MAKNNTKLSFLRQGTQTEEGCFVESAEAILRRPGKKEKKEKIYNNIKLFSLTVVTLVLLRASTEALAKRNFIGPPTHAGTILYCSCVGTLGGEVL